MKFNDSQEALFMHKKIITILLVAASTFASSAFSANIVNKFIKKHSSAASLSLSTHAKGKTPILHFTDFSGTWLTNCGDGQNIDQPTVITNSADYIIIDGEEFRIGQGLQGKYNSNEEYAGSEHASVEWNTNGTELTMRSTTISKENADNSAIQVDMSQFTLSMKNGQIIADGKWTMLEDGKIIGMPVNEMRCVLTKSDLAGRQPS